MTQDIGDDATTDGKAGAADHTREGGTLRGACHCGAVRFRIAPRPDTATICNCSVCRRYGAIWAYGWLEGGAGPEVVVTGGARTAYVRGDREIAFHRCAACGCLTDWTGLVPQADGRVRIAVNLRLADPAEVADVPLRLFDGADAFEDRPPDGRCIRDIVV